MAHSKLNSKGEVLTSGSKGRYSHKLTRYGAGASAVVGSLMASSANAAVDVSAAVNTLVSDGTAAISAVGIGLITLAGVAVVFKWVKASFFG